MYKLIKELNGITLEELKRANENFPLFNSNHEGIAIIEEELNETIVELNDLIRHFKHLKRAVFDDDPEEISVLLGLMLTCSKFVCAEAVQTSAMLHKFNISRNERKKNGSGWEEEKRPEQA